MGFFREKRQGAEVVLNSDFFEKLYIIVDQMPGEGIEDKRIAYAGRDNRQFIEVVGESFCQEDLRNFYKPEKWRYGLLVPEQDNKFDSNAVAVYLVHTPDQSDEGEYGVYRVGYLNKDLAKKVSQKIVNLLAQSGIVIPVLAMVKQGAAEDNLAVVAYAMTDLITF
jgi:hypothetical protein